MKNINSYLKKAAFTETIGTQVLEAPNPHGNLADRTNEGVWR